MQMVPMIYEMFVKAAYDKYLHLARKGVTTSRVGSGNPWKKTSSIYYSFEKK